MGKIVLLDELTINQIAAGEVIERPASVVKEMVENSIDAGAKNIIVEIKNGGISYIRISDDGRGIAKDDVELAFERHATSKIRSAADLQEVKSMGFRGEALASIAAIANVELISKTEEDEYGTKIVVEGGNVLNLEETGYGRGTTITVRNLFFNTPVRYKFLKKDFTETGYIEDVISRIALVHPEVAIKLINTGKTVIQTNGNGDLKSVIYSIYGREISEEILPVSYEYEGIKIEGVIGKPAIARSNRSNQIFFVNDRYIKDKTLTAAAEQAYKGIIPIGKFAFLVLNVKIEPSKVDVNVHPAKLEVRFSEETRVFQAVYHAIKNILLQADLISDRERNKEIKEASKDAFKIDYNTINGGLFAKKSYSDLINNNSPSNMGSSTGGYTASQNLIFQTKNNITSQNTSSQTEGQISYQNTGFEKEKVITSQSADSQAGGQTSYQNTGSEKEDVITSQSSNPQTEEQTSYQNIGSEKEEVATSQSVDSQAEGHTSQETRKFDFPEREVLGADQNKEKSDLQANVEEFNVFEKLKKMKEELQNQISDNPSIESTEDYKQVSEKYNNIAKVAEDINQEADKNDIKEQISSFDEMYKKLFGKAPISTRSETDENKIENEYKITQQDLDDNISVFEDMEEYQQIPYKFIGIAFKTYIILEMEQELFIMDQHAAHERILYEKVKKNFYSSSEKDSQLLLLPDIITLTNKEMAIAKDNFKLFEQAGFMVEEFGENTVKVSGVPEICIDLDTKELFLETLDEINTVARTAKQEKEEKFIATVACKAAVKANMALTEEEVTSLMNELLKLPNPFSCPHGRPTVIKMSKYDIEFARK